MKEFLKKYFIPHENNGHKPHFLRWETALIVLSAVLIVEIIFLLQIFVIFPNTKFFASILPSVLVDLTNTDRQGEDCPALRESPVLEQVAQAKADDMANKGYFAHTSPEGLTPWYWFQKMGYSFYYAGENLAVNFFDSQDIVNAWMNSPTHRANILNCHFTEIGIGIAQGLYEGRESFFVVQSFGTPAFGISSLAQAGTVAVTDSNVKRPAAPSIKTNVSQKTDVAALNISTSSPMEESFVAVKSESTSVPVTAAGGNISQPIEYSSFINKLIASPRIAADLFYITIFTIVLIALLLKVFIKIKIQHPPLIVNGIALLLIIASVIVLNQYLITVHARISGY